MYLSNMKFIEEVSHMELKMVCATWVQEEDEKVLKILEESDRWLSAEELSIITNLPLSRVHRTLGLLKQQRGMYEGRKKLSDYLD